MVSKKIAGSKYSRDENDSSGTSFRAAHGTGKFEGAHKFLSQTESLIIIRKDLEQPDIHTAEGNNRGSLD